MTKAKGKKGIGQGTGKKRWSRWQASAKKVSGVKPYRGKDVKDSSSNNKDK